MSKVVIKHFHLFCGLGGGAKGFNNGQAKVGQMEAEFKCLGGVDNDPAALHDFEQEANAKGTLLDLFNRDQYISWHGHEPPEGWTEATPDDIRKAAGYERPNAVFTSSPCKGLTGLLSEELSKSDKYQALNELTLRGIWLTLETWSDDPPEFILFENVPRIVNRGRFLLDQIQELLHRYGYATAENTHDCGELGGLGQSRRRFLLVARHMEKVPPFLYEPEIKPLRSVGEVLGPFPLPGSEIAGPMHRIPRLQWKTWLRLALVEAGSDWRSLEKLNVKDGFLTDYGIVPETDFHGGVFGVHHWKDHTGTITGRAGPTNGAYSVADPRLNWHPAASRNKFRITEWNKKAGTVIGARGPADGAGCIADPRAKTGFNGKGKYRITPFNAHAGTVISGSTTGQGAFALADPRVNLGKNKTHNYHKCGRHYGVVPWDQHSNVITANSKHDNGYNSVADPRLPEERDQGEFIIRALDDTWHRPFTTLELAALQGLVDPGEYLELYGKSDSAWRERIGNAVPPPTAAAIASVIGTTILLARSGETFLLSNQDIWVKPIAIATAVDIPVMEKSK